MTLFFSCRIGWIYSALIVVSLAAACADRHSPPTNQAPQASSSPAALNAFESPFGNPSDAKADPQDRDNYLIADPDSAISYNDSRGTPNWVAWRTTKVDLGDRLERPDFEPDPRLPKGFKKISSFNYSHSGYQRGHLLPSADRFGNRAENSETFLMTNIVPQTADLNEHPWNDLESYVRAQARRGMDAYQIAGAYGLKTRLRGGVAVPTNCWKIVIFVPHGQAVEPDRGPRIVAVDMPNINGIKSEPWQRYKTSIREIEKRSGLDFFATLPQDVQDRLETRVEMVNR